MKAQASQSSRTARRLLYALMWAAFAAWPTVLLAQSVPLPVRNPLRLAPSLPMPPPHPREREVDEWSAQNIQIANDQCAIMLDGNSAVYEAIPPIREGDCGAPSPILLHSIGTKLTVAIEPPARVTCGLAASLATWSDGVLQPAAEKYLGTAVRSIRNVASYVCRNRYNMPDKRISQHALANALDMASFTLADGQQVSVLEHWHEEVALVSTRERNAEEAEPDPQKTESSVAQPPVFTATQPAEPEPSPAAMPTVRALFLRELHSGGCALFGTVLGPLANEAHKDHFHFDLAERNYGNFCE